jgi:hypothetical protein
MISPSICHPWQPDRAANAAQQRRCYTTAWDMIVATGLPRLVAYLALLPAISQKSEWADPSKQNLRLQHRVDRGLCTMHTIRSVHAS